MKTVNHVATPAQRLLASGITASTLELVRSLREGRSAERLQQLMSERRRMLGELQSGPVTPGFQDLLNALRIAVAESDRTVEALRG